MRILCVTPWFPSQPGAQEGNFVAASVDALVAEGHAVKVLVVRPWRPALAGWLRDEWQPRPLQPQLHDDALGLELVQYLSVPRNRLRALSCWSLRRALLPAVQRAIDDFHPDVIVVHTEMPAQAVVTTGVATGVATEKTTGVPTVVVLHGINTSELLDTPTERERLRRTLDAADRVVLVGEPLRDHFAERSGHSDHFRIVPNGFLLPTPAQRRPATPWPATLGLISVSNLVYGKGIDLTLHALGELQRQGVTDWHYTIVGGGSERETLEALAQAEEIAERVTFTGPVEHSAVYDLLMRNEVFVLPSWREAFGVAWLEAMGCGLLAIGVQGQGPAAFIDDGVTGLLVVPRAVDSLVSCLHRVCSEREAMQALAQRGQDKVSREFTWAAHARALVAVCAEAVEARQ